MLIEVVLATTFTMYSKYHKEYRKDVVEIQQILQEDGKCSQEKIENIKKQIEGTKIAKVLSISCKDA